MTLENSRAAFITARGRQPSAQRANTRQTPRGHKQLAKAFIKRRIQRCYRRLITALSNLNKIDVFAFVIMPNHIHLIWRIKEMNGKETPQGSFLKFTAHEFKKMLKRENHDALKSYAVSASNKNFEFWQRDPLAIRLYTKEVAIQKLRYIHNNPMAEHWSLVKDPCDYKYSSAHYYERNEKNFEFLKDLLHEF